MTNLAIASCAVGGLKIVGSLCALAAPGAAARLWKAFPRHRVWGWMLTAVTLVWSGWLVLTTPPFSGMARIEPMVYAGVPLLFFLLVTFMDELLAARALGGLLLLLATPVLSAARWHDSGLSVLMTVVAYAWVIAGMWLVISPYRFRMSVDWLSANHARFRFGNLLGLGVGIALLTLGLTVY